MEGYITTRNCLLEEKSPASSESTVLTWKRRKTIVFTLINNTENSFNNVLKWSEVYMVFYMYLPREVCSPVEWGKNPDWGQTKLWSLLSSAPFGSTNDRMLYRATFSEIRSIITVVNINYNNQTNYELHTLKIKTVTRLITRHQMKSQLDGRNG